MLTGGYGMKDKKAGYMHQILAQLDNCLTETNLPLPGKKQGKVRDTYQLEDRMVLITTDRQSAFDRVLASVPFKGQALNLTSAWWFEQTSHIIKNHVTSVPDPNVTVADLCTPFPIEFVVRGYITGSTDTALWTRYAKGERTYCGIHFPDGLIKHQKLHEAVITPTTKEAHDRPIAPDEIFSEGWMTREDWLYCSAKALELFAFGQEKALEHGLILVDTKYEMGTDSRGNIVLIDEIHTPDSSRYWIAESYEDRMRAGTAPEHIDKEFLRTWFVEHCDPYHDEVLPQAPVDLIAELSYRYIMLYEMITGRDFPFPEPGIPVSQRFEIALQGILQEYGIH